MVNSWDPLNQQMHLQNGCVSCTQVLPRITHGLQRALPHQMKRVFMTFSRSKAVAPSFLPSIFWREHAELASQLIDQRMQNLRQHSSRRTPQEWSGSHVVLLPKPGKSSAKPSNLRPISLLEASGKAAMGALASGLISQLWHHLCGYPQ